MYILRIVVEMHKNSIYNVVKCGLWKFQVPAAKKDVYGWSYLDSDRVLRIIQPFKQQRIYIIKLVVSDILS